MSSQDGSESKDALPQAYGPEFNPWNHMVEKEH